MRELIRIEIKKINLKKEVQHLAIINVALFAILSVMLIGLAFMNEGADMGGYVVTNLFIKGVFFIYQAVFISSMIVEEFKSKTIMQLFTYPIKRTAILGSKLLLICMIILPFSLITHVIQHSLFAFLSVFIQAFSYLLDLQVVSGIVLMTPFLIMLGMIPLTVGLWMKSTIAPIVAAMILSGLIFNISPASMPLTTNLLVIGIMGVGAAIFVFMTVKDEMKKDFII